MKLYEIDYRTVTTEDRMIWEKLKKDETVYNNDRPSIIRKSRYRDYPKAVRHYLSLFPNNFLDVIDLMNSRKLLNNILNKFDTLIDDISKNERDIQKFIKDNRAWFIIASILKNNYPFGNHAIFIFPEFQLPPDYKVDYLLVGKNSDGYHFVFVELEAPYGRITCNNGSYGNSLRKGITQIDNWECWIEQNFSSLKLVFQGLTNKDIVLPNEFRDFDKTRVHYLVIAGRRTDFNERTYRKKRLDLEQRKLLIIHYDNLIDFAREYITPHSY